ncbi:MAG TPA: alpha/beta fold hydrolase [Chitinophagaceae bacterium]|nr:alpha/beta fold hydrolase [Chitinophagaceae bacterium]
MKPSISFLLLGSMMLANLCCLAQTASFAEDSISFMSDGYKISGTISYPNTKGKAPAIILVWGNGPHTRDQRISGTPMFREMADYFNRQGYAVMRLDKRGFGKSEGPKGQSESVTTSADLSNDIHEALQLLKRNKRVNAASIGLMGHSEGAWIAEMVAVRDTTVKWLVALAGHLANGGLVRELQMTENLTRLGAEPEVVERVRPQIKRLVEFVRKDYNNDSMYYAIGADFLRAHGVQDSAITHKFIDQLLDAFRSPWVQYFFSHAPADTVAALRCPALFVFGDRDRNISPALNIPALAAAMQKSDNPNLKASVLADHDHFFLHYNGKSLERHKPGEMHVSVRMLKEVSAWMETVR